MREKDRVREMKGGTEQGFYTPRSSVRFISTKLAADARLHAIRGNIVAALNALLLIKLYIRASVDE